VNGGIEFLVCGECSCCSKSLFSSSLSVLLESSFACDAATSSTLCLKRVDCLVGTVTGPFGGLCLPRLVDVCSKSCREVLVTRSLFGLVADTFLDLVTLVALGLLHITLGMRKKTSVGCEDREIMNGGQWCRCLTGTWT
jgi:hypothetical protein